MAPKLDSFHNVIVQFQFCLETDSSVVVDLVQVLLKKQIPHLIFLIPSFQKGFTHGMSHKIVPVPAELHKHHDFMRNLTLESRNSIVCDVSLSQPNCDYCDLVVTPRGLWRVFRSCGDVFVVGCPHEVYTECLG